MRCSLCRDEERPGRLFAVIDEAGELVVCRQCIVAGAGAAIGVGFGQLSLLRPRGGRA